MAISSVAVAGQTCRREKSRTSTNRHGNDYKLLYPFSVLNSKTTLPLIILILFIFTTALSPQVVLENSCVSHHQKIDLFLGTAVLSHSNAIFRGYQASRHCYDRVRGRRKRKAESCCSGGCIRPAISAYSLSSLFRGDRPTDDAAKMQQHHSLAQYSDLIGSSKSFVVFARAAWPFPPTTMLHPSSWVGTHLVEDTITFVGGIYYPSRNANSTSRVSSVVMAFSPSEGTWVQTLVLPDRICGTSFSFTSTLITSDEEVMALYISVVYFTYAASFNTADNEGNHLTTWIYAVPSASNKYPFIAQCDGVLNTARMEATFAENGLYMYVIGGVDPKTRAPVRSFEMRVKCCRLFEDCAAMTKRADAASWRQILFPEGILSIRRGSAVSFSPLGSNQTLVMFGGITVDPAVFPGCTNAIVRMRLSETRGLEIVECTQGGRISGENVTNAVKMHDAAFTRGPDSNLLYEVRANGGVIIHPTESPTAPGSMLLVVSGSVAAMGGMTSGFAEIDFMKRKMTNAVGIVYEFIPSASTFSVFFLPPVLPSGAVLGTLACQAGSRLCANHMKGVVLSTSMTCEQPLAVLDRRELITKNNSRVDIRLEKNWFLFGQYVTVCVSMPSCLNADLALERGLSDCHMLNYRENCATEGWCTVMNPAGTRFCCPDRKGPEFLHPVLPRSYLVSGAAPPNTTTTPAPTRVTPKVDDEHEETFAEAVSRLWAEQTGLFIALVVGVVLLACFLVLFAALMTQLWRVQRVTAVLLKERRSSRASGGGGDGSGSDHDKEEGSLFAAAHYDTISLAGSTRSLGGASMSTVGNATMARRRKGAGGSHRSGQSSLSTSRRERMIEDNETQTTSAAAMATSTAVKQYSGVVRVDMASSCSTTANHYERQCHHASAGGDAEERSARLTSLSREKKKRNPNSKRTLSDGDSSNSLRRHVETAAVATTINDACPSTVAGQRESEVCSSSSCYEDLSTTTTANTNTLGKYTLIERLYCSRDRKTHIFRGYATPSPAATGGAKWGEGSDGGAGLVLAGDSSLTSPLNVNKFDGYGFTSYALKVILCPNEEDRLEATAEYNRLKKYQQHAGVVKVVDYFVQWADDPYYTTSSKKVHGAATCTGGRDSKNFQQTNSQSGGAGRSGVVGGKSSHSPSCTATLSSAATGGGIDVASLLRGCHRYVCIVMHLYKGGDLGAVTRLYPEPIITEGIIVKVTAQIANTLGYLHQLSPPVVHGNLRADNILLDPKRNRVVLADFGRATEAGSSSTLHPTKIVTSTAQRISSSSSSSASSPLAASSSPPFLSSSVKGSIAARREDDILSLGLIAYAMATRKSMRAAALDYLSVLEESLGIFVSGGGGGKRTSTSEEPLSDLVPNNQSCCRGTCCVFGGLSLSVPIGGSVAGFFGDSSCGCAVLQMASVLTEENTKVELLPALRANMRPYSSAFVDMVLRMLNPKPSRRPDAHEVIRLCLDACPSFTDVRLAEV